MGMLERSLSLRTVMKSTEILLPKKAPVNIEAAKIEELVGPTRGNVIGCVGIWERRRLVIRAGQRWQGCHWADLVLAVVDDIGYGFH